MKVVKYCPRNETSYLHSIHWCVWVPKPFFSSSGALIEMRLYYVFQPCSRHICPDARFSSPARDLSQPASASPFDSYGIVFCTTTCLLWLLPYLPGLGTIVHAIHTMYFASWNEPKWGSLCIISRFHFESYHCIPHRSVIRSISDLAWYLVHGVRHWAPFYSLSMSTTIHFLWIPTILHACFFPIFT